MNTKDIEKLKDEAINIWSEHDIYQALDHVITTLTRHREAEVERRVDEYKQFVLNVLDGVDIADGYCNTKAIRFALQSRIITTPTKTDKQ